MFRPKYVQVECLYRSGPRTSHISLTFIVKVAENLEDKMAQAIPILKERTGPAIVYVTLQAHAEEGARLLQESGLPAKMYHAGMSNENRQSVQEYFMASDDGIVSVTSPPSCPSNLPCLCRSLLRSPLGKDLPLLALNK